MSAISRIAARWISRAVICGVLCTGSVLSASLAAAQTTDSLRIPPTPQSTDSGFLRIEEFLAAHEDFGKAAKRFTPEIEFSTYYIPEAELDDAEGEFDLTRYELDALIPLPVSRDTFLIAGAHAGARDYKLSGATGFDDETLYNVGLRFGAGKFFTDDFVVQGYWQPSIYSDFDGSLRSEDYKLWYSAALAVYRANPQLFWKGGFLVSDAINTGVIPVAGVSWIFMPQWRLDILAPRLFEVSYLPTEDWDLHSGVRIDAEKFAIRQDRELGGGEDGEIHRNVRVQDIRWYAGALHKFDSGLSLFVRAGVAIAGEYDWKDEFEGHTEPSPFVNGGLGWSF